MRALVVALICLFCVGTVAGLCSSKTTCSSCRRDSTCKFCKSTDSSATSDECVTSSATCPMNTEVARSCPASNFTGGIVGIVLAVAAVVAIGFGVWYFLRRQKKLREQRTAEREKRMRHNKSGEYSASMDQEPSRGEKPKEQRGLDKKQIDKTKAMLSDPEALKLTTKRAFRRFDVNKDGVLSKDEVREAADYVCLKGKLPPFTAKEFDAFFAELDVDSNGKVDRKEFHSLVRMALESGVELSGESSDL
eukprot:a509173_683.p1 GENE.a509173_683~~a509173_683.p1  ORF type:complete len:260 (+),score=87.33 a509173_683:35-781(+)